jgi:hypothetical protein
MPKLSISLAAVMLSVSLSPAAYAYGTEPAPQTLLQISEVFPADPQSAKIEGTCSAPMTPDLAEILGLSDVRRGYDTQRVLTSLACADQ